MSSFWADRRVLVTGGSGFVGRTVCRKLAEKGARQVVAHRSSEYDLRRLEDAEKLFETANPDLVIHLAARVAGIGGNMDRPADLFRDNLLIGTFVLEAARRQRTPKTVLVGTICSYPKFTPVPFKEESLWEGYPEETNAPYGVAKLALLVHADVNRRQHGQHSIYVMPTNMYGPGDKFNPAVSHVIPALIKKCVEAKEQGEREMVVGGTGSPTREFLYVDDAAEGILLAAEHYEEPEPVNLGTGQEISIRDLAEIIVRQVGFEGTLRWDPSFPDGQPRRCVDASRARAAFGFQPTMSFDKGLRRTIDWYLSNRREAEAVSG